MENFLPWAETAAEAITELGKQPGVDPKRIGVVGVSLGASLGNSLATQDSRIAAVVDCFGTLPPFVEQHASRFAPTLILHGEDDAVVPVREATQLEAALKAHHIPYEIKLYPGQGHGFTGAALTDAEQRTVAFLTRYLS
jgi:carboxymethylenebutenolidase